MTRITWTRWLGNHDDVNDKGVLGLLYTIETAFVRMTKGSVMFLWHAVPNFWRVLLVRLRSILQFATRLIVRLLRLTLAIIAWLATVFAPIAVYPGVVSFSWMAIALVGSVWGLRRSMKKGTGLKVAAQ